MKAGSRQGCRSPGQASSQSTNQSINQAVKQAAKKAISQSTNQSTTGDNQTVNQAPFGQSTTASLACNKVSHGKNPLCMAKTIQRDKSYGVWVLSCIGIFHTSMA